MNLREMGQKRLEKDTLCWYCKNASSTREHLCVWANYYQPVKGWEATPTIVMYKDQPSGSFKVEKCPNFIKLR